MDYDYSLKGRIVKIIPGANEELFRRNWHRGVSRNYDGDLGTIRFEFGKNTGDHHYSIEFSDGESVGFPPNFVQFV